MVKRVAIVGATGYVGPELVSRALRHAGMDVVALYASSAAADGEPAGLRGALGGAEAPEVQPLSRASLLDSGADAVFLATPHALSADLVPELRAHDVAVIDLSGAYRLRNADDYRTWYGFEHPAPALLEQATYGLTEWCRGSLRGCGLVANPGCYATAVLLALKPLADILAPAQPIICDAKSGVSGAGKRQSLEYSFVELAGNCKAYRVGNHAHTPEILLQLGAKTTLRFVPHLLPTPRGILATTYVSFDAPHSAEDVRALYETAYGDAPLVHVEADERLPELRDVVHTPHARIGACVLEGGTSAVVVSVLDNLLKGAATQAIQNFNSMYGFEPTAGVM